MPDPIKQRLLNLFLPGTVSLPPYPESGDITLETLSLPDEPGKGAALPLLKVTESSDLSATTTWVVRYDLVLAICIAKNSAHDWQEGEWFFLPLNEELREAMWNELKRRDQPLRGLVFLPEDAPISEINECGRTAGEVCRPRNCDPFHKVPCDPFKRPCDPFTRFGDFSYESVMRMDESE